MVWMSEWKQHALYNRVDSYSCLFSISFTVLGKQLWAKSILRISTVGSTEGVTLEDCRTNDADFANKTPSQCSSAQYRFRVKTCGDAPAEATSMGILLFLARHNSQRQHQLVVVAAATKRTTRPTRVESSLYTLFSILAPWHLFW
jgi:hypothetical protein